MNDQYLQVSYLGQMIEKELKIQSISQVNQSKRRSIAFQMIESRESRKEKRKDNYE